MIAHPPCTHLAVSGARWFKDKIEEQAAALDFVRCLLAAKQPQLTIPDNHGQVLDSFLPRRGLRGTELQNIFYCTTQHIAELDAAGLIVVERDALARSGPRASKLYSRDSVVNFLSARALAALPMANPATDHPLARN
jgi:hypothetical protein